jgi:hypothetical protein
MKRAATDLVTAMSDPRLFGNPWSFPCQLPAVGRGPTDVDGVRTVGIDTTNTVWVRLRVPPEWPANVWIAGNGYADFAEHHATELLHSSGVWCSLNPEAVRRLTPDLMPPEPEQPPPEPEPGGWQEYRQQVAIRRASWPVKRARIEAELKRDPAKNDKWIALELGSARAVIRTVRRKLEQAGAIPHVRPDRRATRPRPKFYKKRVRP